MRPCSSKATAERLWRGGGDRRVGSHLIYVRRSGSCARRFLRFRGSSHLRAIPRSYAPLSRAPPKNSILKNPRLSLISALPPPTSPPPTPASPTPRASAHRLPLMREGRPRTAAGAPCEFIAAGSPTYERRLRFENRAKRKKKKKKEKRTSVNDRYSRQAGDGRATRVAGGSPSPLPASSSSISRSMAMQSPKIGRCSSVCAIRALPPPPSLPCGCRLLLLILLS